MTSTKIRYIFIGLGTLLTTCILVAVLYYGYLYTHPHTQLHFMSLRNMFSLPSISKNSRDGTDVSNDASGTITWKQLKATQVDTNEKNGIDEINPQYSAELLALNHKPVRIKGFMFPLDASSNQSKFLLSPYSPSCPFCLPAGASELIEVHPLEPAPIYGRSITVTGELELLTKQADLKDGMLYKINNAEIEN